MILAGFVFGHINMIIRKYTPIIANYPFVLIPEIVVSIR